MTRKRCKIPTVSTIRRTALLTILAKLGNRENGMRAKGEEERRREVNGSQGRLAGGTVGVVKSSWG